MSRNEAEMTLPEWNDLPEAARVEACRMADEIWNDGLAGQAALDIYNAIREACENHAQRSPMKP